MAVIRSALLALSAISLVLVSSCTAPQEPPAAPGAGPPELAEFYGQQVAFEPCAPYATSVGDARTYASGRFDCARVQVPRDYADPDGPREEIALLRAKARGDRIGSLLVNPGGPGGSGASLVAGLGPLWDRLPVGERFDVIGFDPRGVGASTPRVDCYTDAEIDRGAQPDTYQFDVPDAAAAGDIARRCIEGTGAEALTGVGSSNVVQDMDVLRAALGEEKLSYLGYSYGSELGAMYAERFPQNLRAMVIDGAVDPTLTEGEFRLSQFAAWQRTFDDLAVTCAATPDCPLGTDPARATEAFHALVRPLQDEPATTADGRGLTYAEAMRTVSLSMFSPVQRQVLVPALQELAAGRGDALLALRDVIAGRGPDGRYGGATHLEANLAIRCMDNPRRTPEEQAEQRRLAYAAAPFLDPGGTPGSTHYECEAWPEPVSRPLPWLTGAADLPPTLTVSVTGDPGTPHQGGVGMAERLGGSLLTVDGTQHGVAFTGVACVDRIVTDYLVDLGTPPDGARCAVPAG